MKYEVDILLSNGRFRGIIEGENRQDVLNEFLLTDSEFVTIDAENNSTALFKNNINSVIITEFDERRSK